MFCESNTTKEDLEKAVKIIPDYETTLKKLDSKNSKRSNNDFTMSSQSVKRQKSITTFHKNLHKVSNIVNMLNICLTP